MITGHWLETVINGPAHHTLHHLYFTVNYGQVSPFHFPTLPDTHRVTVFHMGRQNGGLLSTTRVISRPHAGSQGATGSQGSSSPWKNTIERAARRSC